MTWRVVGDNRHHHSKASSIKLLSMEGNGMKKICWPAKENHTIYFLNIINSTEIKTLNQPKYIWLWNNKCHHSQRPPLIKAQSDAGWVGRGPRGHPAHPTAAPRGPPPVATHRRKVATRVWVEERSCLHHLHDTYQAKQVEILCQLSDISLLLQRTRSLATKWSFFFLLPMQIVNFFTNQEAQVTDPWLSVQWHWTLVFCVMSSLSHELLTD